MKVSRSTRMCTYPGEQVEQHVGPAQRVERGGQRAVVARQRAAHPRGRQRLRDRTPTALRPTTRTRTQEAARRYTVREHWGIHN